MKHKWRRKVITAFVLVLAVAASMWVTTRAMALTISFPTLPSSVNVGNTYSFTTKVDIRDYELLPIQSIDMEIYNASTPSQKATMTDLPLVGGGTKTVTGSGGTISITNTTVTNWNYNYDYGYAVWEDTGTAYYFGYGYGYGPGAASIEYAVSWTSPSSWPTGGYKVKMTITANGTTFTKSGDFTLTAPSAPPGGGGGGGGLEAPPGITYVSDYTGTSGIFIKDIYAESEDEKAVLFIPKGTKGKTKQNEPLWAIEMFEELEPSAFPAGATGIGPVYDISPEGCIFETPITLTITYDQGDVPAGVDEADMVIAMWDYNTGRWVTLEGSTVDPDANTITAPITLFTDYAILTYTIAAASFTTDDLTIEPVEVDIGEPITISVLVTNTGGQVGQYTVILKINDEVLSTQSVALAGGSSQMVTFTDVPTDVAGTYTVTIDALSGTFTVKTAVIAPPPLAAAFTTSALTIAPAEVKTGEPVTISVRVTNTGGATGTYTATLKIDDTAVDTKDVTLAAGSSQIVTFTDIPTDVAGSYTVDINGLSGTFTVKTMLNWWIIGAIIALGIALGVVVYRLVLRQYFARA